MTGQDADPVAWAAGLTFRPMTMDAAREIVAAWRYPAPYDFYDIAADADDLEEFLTPDQWPAVHQQVRDGDVLVGFFSADTSTQATTTHGTTTPETADQTGTAGSDPAAPGAPVVEVSLGLHPDLTGRGKGLAFLRGALDRLRPTLAPGTRITLSVAAFNERAIRVYERAGFVETRRFEQPTNGGVHPFVAMELRD